MKRGEYQVVGRNKAALFTLKLHRGEGMLLLAMNWKKNIGEPPNDFVGFAIEYKEPNGTKFYTIKNRLSFQDTKGKVSKVPIPSLLAPIQKFRWIHFPRNADKDGKFVYRVTPVFMNDKEELSYGESQQAAIALKRETYPNLLNVAFTRGYVSSQAFVDRYESRGAISTLLPPSANVGLSFRQTHPDGEEALKWMGFEARAIILEILDQAVADVNSQVRVVAYDLNEPEILARLENLGSRLKIIIDDEGSHGDLTSAESLAENRLRISTGNNNYVKRQHMGHLQHNKTILVDSPNLKAAICGSTNFSWRGLYVQSNNALIVFGETAIQPFLKAFQNYWADNAQNPFENSDSAEFIDLKLPGVDAKISFSPHSKDNALLSNIADDIENGTKSSLLYSLAFLYQTRGSIKKAITKVTSKSNIFVYGVSDKKVGGLEVQKPNGNIAPVYASTLSRNVPEPFKSEPFGGSGVRMHHKFTVIDFNKPTARVYLGSYNFSDSADLKNGENLLLICNRKIAVSYMIEALRIVDHYHFRVSIRESEKVNKILCLKKPPRSQIDEPWWREYYTDAIKISDRKLFS